MSKNPGNARSPLSTLCLITKQESQKSTSLPMPKTAIPMFTFLLAQVKFLEDRQTMKILIRLLLEQSDLGLPCLLIFLSNIKGYYSHFSISH